MSEEYALPEISQTEIPRKEKRKNSPHNDGTSSSRVITWGCGMIMITFTVLCCILPMMAFGAIAFVIGVTQSNEVVKHDTETLDISEGVVNLEVTNVVGETRIRGENDVDEITVEIERSATGLTKKRAEDAVDDIKVNVERKGNRYIIEVENFGDGGLFNDRSVKLLITVPEKLNITAENNVGALSVRDVEIVDELDLRNNVGGIEFDGKIEGDGNYKIVNDVGGISVEVDPSSEFKLEAEADVGGIDSNLNLDKEQVTKDIPGQRITGVYGNDDDPDATLVITANVGGIELRD